jgi:hypothetical protein
MMHWLIVSLNTLVDQYLAENRGKIQCIGEGPIYNVDYL